MKMPIKVSASLWMGAFLFLWMASGCIIQPPQNSKARMTLFVGVDASGSFEQSGYYDNAIGFLARYIYGHLNAIGELTPPRELFVGSIGGKTLNEPKVFHPIHDFQGKSHGEIEASLKEWFPPSDAFTDFNSFFEQVGRITKERNLTLAPITVMIVTDGIPDAASRNVNPSPNVLYKEIDLGPMEYLSRNLTLRLTYTSPQVSSYWRKHVPRQRVRLWTVDAEIMKGWVEQVQPEVDLDQQHQLWKWMRDNVDYRVRSKGV